MNDEQELKMNEELTRDEARELAARLDGPLSPGPRPLDDVEEAVAAARVGNEQEHRPDARDSEERRRREFHRLSDRLNEQPAKDEPEGDGDDDGDGDESEPDPARLAESILEDSDQDAARLAARILGEDDEEEA